MKVKTLLLLVVIVWSCKSENAKNSNHNGIQNSDTKIDNREGVDDVSDVASIIKGEYKGHGTYTLNNAQRTEIQFTNINVTRKNDKEIVVSSPAKEFPSFVVTHLVEQFSTIVGTADEEGGFLTYTKSQKKIKGIIKSYEDGSGVFRFMMP